ncbi:nucleotidyltransferase family protein [Aquibacillus kalidii]|uniref:nucleotidyltransferase family protein n=1 Tax=Aquibacillus kalidii TaxID=2762597 RepID=UPI001F4905F1|nr:nucleotidyltransferase family protein [Aquibacillus kalidii]
MGEKDIISIIEQDKWMTNILHAAKQLALPDWWICAGFVRAKVWDSIHDFSERTILPDVDVVYFDPNNLSEITEKRIEKQLYEWDPHVPWSVKNEARMHHINGVEPYKSSIDAISKFPETATAIGVKMSGDDNIVLASPCGIKDLVNLKVKPTQFFKENKNLLPLYQQRVEEKNWQSIWSRLLVYSY